MSETQTEQVNQGHASPTSCLEAMLFTSGDPVKKARLAKALSVSLEDLDVIVGDLQEQYVEQASGLAIVDHKDAVQLVTAPAVAEQVEDFVAGARDEDLSRASLEVLAIVAYRSPVSRTEVDAIRGVNCSFSLRNLMLRGLIERVADPENPRTYLYRVTNDFLTHLGLSSVDDLPDFAALNANPKIAQVMGVVPDEA